MIASLPMYASPLTAGADGRLWHGIRDRLRDTGIPAPNDLTLGITDLMAHWRSPDLVISQTCGLPYRAILMNEVTLVGTADYGIKGCPPGHYCSMIIARDDDRRTNITEFTHAPFAFNDPMSQSGWAALAMECPQVLQGRLVQTGSHLASVLAVQSGKADFAAIDAVSWRHILAENEATGLKIIRATRPTPGLPFITAKKHDDAAIRLAVQDAVATLAKSDQAVLGLRGIVALPRTTYDIPLPPAPSVVPA